MTEQTLPEVVAAVDLGSNSFHMIVARINESGINVLDRLKETVRLASGLDEHNIIKFDAGQRALACLSRFGQRIRDLPPGAVRAVGTNTLRKARNSAAFLSEARRALGHPIEVINGREEARLIYLGVAHSLADDLDRRLVVDIGGGSTEVIIGSQFDPLLMESLYMGCVSMTSTYFPDGLITVDAWRRATIAARLELRPVARSYRLMGWNRAIGASGTILAIDKVVREMGWCDVGISLESLYKLRDSLLEAGAIERLAMIPGVTSERAEVFPGGVAILLALFEGLKIERMAISDGALREGLIYDLIGRIRHEDVRGRTIASLTSRFQVDTAQAECVEATAVGFFDSVAQAWALNETNRELLSWATRLHELGLSIAHNQYHKHGAYLLQNADLPGFSRPEQQSLAAMLRAHRRKFMPELFEQVPSEDRQSIMRLAILLRLAVLLSRSRDKNDIPIRKIDAGKRSLKIEFESGTLDKHPLTRADLENEVAFLKAGGFKLKYR